MPAISAGQMRLVLDVSRMLAVTSDLDVLLNRIAESVTALLDCDRASIFLHDPKADELWTKVALQSQPIRINSTAGIVGAAFRSNQVLIVPEPYKDPRFNPEPDRRSGFVTRNILAAPMVDIRDKPIGVLQAINKSSGSFMETDAAMLQLLADQAGVAIQRYQLQQAAVDSTALRREMELAKRVQEAMIPTRRPDVPGLEAAGWTRAASINGGDCFDLWKLPDGRLGVLVADASGHGIAPALVVTQTRALIRTLCDTEPDPMKLLLRVNARLVHDLDTGRFVTAFLCFASGDGWLHWCSFGHGPLMLTAPNSAARELQANLPPLGIVSDPVGQATGPVRLELGGALVVATDGITEAFNPAGDMFGASKVLQAMNGFQSSLDAAISSVQKAVAQWQQRDEPKDDQTLVIVKRVSQGQRE